jgi:large subunit ribosomal protein L10
MQVTKKTGKGKKTELLSALKDSLSKAKTIILADYTGLTHKQLEEVRRLIKKAEGELTVTKNSLLKKALDASKKVIDETHLQGATATLFAFGDEVAPLKALVKFFKDTTRGRVKAGLLGDKMLTEEEVNRLSTLPGRGQLLSKLVDQLQAPISGLHNALSWNIRTLVWTLDAVKSKKSS